MANLYSSVGSDLEPYELTNADLIAIGKLVRATAEIEDLVNGWLSQVSGIPLVAINHLIGKAGLASRVGLAQKFAQARGPNSLLIHNGLFETDRFRSIFKIRNTVVHGALLGLSETGQMTFLVSDPGEMREDGSVPNIAIGVKQKDILLAAEMAEGQIPIMETALRLRAWRAERRKQVLEPHSKSQGRRQPKQKPPQRSSPG